MAIVCKSAAEIEKMRRSGAAVHDVLEHVKAHVKPGVTTLDLEVAAESKIAEFVKEYRAKRLEAKEDINK